MADETATKDTATTPEKIEGDLDLTVAVTEKGPCEKRLAITVSKGAIAGKFETTLDELARTLHLPGFRPGKAPRKLIERRFGERVEHDVRDALHEDGVKQVVEAKGWDLIGQPTLEHDHDHDDPEHDPHKVSPEADYVFEVTVDIRPAFQLPDFGSIKIQKPSMDITDEHVDEEIRKIKQERGQWVPAAKRGAQANDMVIFDAEFLVDDAVVHTSEGAEAVLPADTSQLKAGYEWIAKFTGKKPKGKFTYKGELPPDLPAEAHRGAAGVIKVQVRSVKEMELPDFDEAWLKELGTDSEDGLRNRIREQLEATVARSVDDHLDNAILAAILERTPIELPKRVVEREADGYLRRYEVALRNKRVDEAEIPKLMQEARTQRTGEVEASFRRYLLLDEIAKQEKVFVTEDDVAARLAEMAAHYHRTVPELEAELEAKDMMRDLRHELREEKVKQLLRKKVTVEG